MSSSILKSPKPAMVIAAAFASDDPDGRSTIPGLNACFKTVMVPAARKPTNIVPV